MTYYELKKNHLAKHIITVLLLSYSGCAEKDTSDFATDDTGWESDTAFDSDSGAAGDADNDVDVDTVLNSDSEDGTSGEDTASNTDSDAAKSVCGDGVVEGEETCDDSNAKPGDGCSGICQREPGYTCPEEGGSCTRTSVCGNKIVDQGEACDDGNNDLDDGCDTDCRVEPGWACDDTGCHKVDVNICGDGKVGVGEQCDDGVIPPQADDGCDVQCQVEEGWRCPKPGKPCELLETEFCGNGKVEEGETCDDTNVVPGDGCSANCKVEDGYQCDDLGCDVVCGDGLVIGSEACDDGNEKADDGCAADCSEVEEGYLCPVGGGVGGPCIEKTPSAVCPNGILEFGEQCDDGNNTPSDGCTGCTVDDGYRCVSPGKPCERLPFCGDGYVDLQLGEQCDDANQLATDGCNGECQVVAGFICPVPKPAGERLLGGSCRQIVCGDGAIEGDEQCDDGVNPPKNGDGCNTDCQLEPGWTCPKDMDCQARACGDGIQAGFEECDNGDKNGSGQVKNGVICAADCQVVPDETLCRNGHLDPGEACDDGNNNLGDGCTVFCKKEPICRPGEPCTTECGDGIVLGDEECDDGNTRNGDGCSASCKIEPGFICEEIVPNEFVVPIVYRDFKAFEGGGHVAFQSLGIGGLTPREDIWVRTTLGTEDDTMPDGTSLIGKPIFKWYAQCDSNGCVDIAPGPGVHKPLGTGNAASCNAIQGSATGIKKVTSGGRNVYFCGYSSQDFFTYSQWYRDSPGINQTLVSTLQLDLQTGGEYLFYDSSFFNLDGLLFGNEGRSHNYHFTSEVRYWFRYNAADAATLYFHGDDDVWVFVNGKLVIDISGIHPAVADNVTINPSVKDIEGQRLNLVDGEVYEIVVFQAERQTVGSNYKLTLQDFSLASSKCHSTCGDGIKASNEQCDRGDVCGDGSSCTNGHCADGSSCNDGSYGGCTKGPDPSTGCKLAGYCGDGVKNGPEKCDNGINNDLYADAPDSGCSAGCVFAPFCGDGKVAVGIEQCDGTDDCEADCTLKPRCGDGALDAGEQCDDGAENGSPASECDVSCRKKCGNGTIDAGEQCDPGEGAFSSEYEGCLPTVGEQRGCVFGPRCGDGVRNGPEDCDDGLNDGTYGTCAPGCVLGARCGDGVLQSPAGESCDEGAANVVNSYLADGDGLCTSVCRPVRYCGDGVVTDGEGCDDGNNSGVAGSCEIDCSAWIELPSCGDGNLDEGEECDAGNENGTVESGCDNTCRIRCGNGVLDSGEDCDDGVNDGSYGTCAPGCQFPGYCGDGEVNGPEQCDHGEENQVNPYGKGLCDLSCRTAPYCGDGRISEAFGEECDGQDGCSPECLWTVVL